jgi:hypothetical protein
MEESLFNKMPAHPFASVTDAEKRFAVGSRSCLDRDRAIFPHHRLTRVDEQVLDYLIHSFHVYQGKERFRKFDLNLMWSTLGSSHRNYAPQHRDQIDWPGKLVFATQGHNRMAETGHQPSQVFGSSAQSRHGVGAKLSILKMPFHV